MIRWAAWGPGATLEPLVPLLTTRSRLVSSLLVGLGSVGVAVVLTHCASGGSRDSGDVSAGSGGSSSSGPSHSVDILGSGVAGKGSDALDPLCGAPEDGTCVPDDAEACAGLGGAGFGGASNAAGAPALAGAAGMVGLPNDDGNLGSNGYSCQLGLDGERVTRSCQPAGQGHEDAPCLSSAQCAPGLACVGAGSGSSGTGLCRPYCCEGVEASCGDGYYCAPRPVVGAVAALTAPVCVRADGCSLTESYPCPSGVDCQCAEGTACTIVRADGTTSCVKPGVGQPGDACDDAFSCSWGHVCSLTNGCLPLCSTVSTKPECGARGYCQARFPSDIGVCIDLNEQTGATK